MSAVQDQAGIVLQGAGLTIRGRVILSDLTLTLTEARIGIVGRNGSGKTSLLRLIAGLVAPSVGTVRVEGIDPARDRKAMLARLGILFQNPDHQILMPTVAEELAFGLRQMGRADAEAVARAALSAEGRAHWADQPVSTLSHGQKQWLCLMSVLLMDPATILLDEPFAAIDLPTEARLTRRLAALPQRLITISHAPAAVASCDRVIWLEGGRVRADGPAAPVLAEFTEAMARLGADDADADISA
jgi:biotin transport system ATP-binding protein